MSEISERIFEKLGPEKETAIEFFAVFSRFESALKCNECIKRNKKIKKDDRAKPNWDDYANYFEKPEKSDIKKEIEEAAKIYLWIKPPKIQIVENVENGMIRCKTAPTSEKITIPDIFNLIRIVRNNLFHGGKYEFGLKKRDEDLVQACLKILYICLKDKNPVTKAFCNGLEVNSIEDDDKDSKKQPEIS